MSKGGCGSRILLWGYTIDTRGYHLNKAILRGCGGLVAAVEEKCNSDYGLMISTSNVLFQNLLLHIYVLSFLRIFLKMFNFFKFGATLRKIQELGSLFLDKLSVYQVLFCINVPL